MASKRRLAQRASISERAFVVYGLRRRLWQDLYHLFMTVSWRTLFACFGAFFLIFNLVFALVYGLQPTDVANVDPPGYWGLFFFSVETFATVGYGDMHPRTPFSHSIASIENFLGLTTLALITGMVFARFSRPTARFLFSRYAVIRPLDGVTTLMIRCANARQNIVMEASAQLRLIRDELTLEGYRIRRIHDLPLRRSQHPIFLFGWNLLHVIDTSSPLYAASAESLEATHAFLLLTISGTDETTGQTLMARARYPGSAIRWNHSFVDILQTDADGVDHFDYRKFHDTEPLPAAPPGTARAAATGSQAERASEIAGQ
jgi:inward rectifier potassium channel